MLLDYYSILRIDPEADLTTIKAAYRQRALECHPDRGGRHEEMVLVNEAWEILGDSDQRRRYDAARHGTYSQSPIDVDVATARARAATYPAQWADFEQWLNTVSQDFRNAEWTSEAFMFGWKFPSPKNSHSAELFVCICAFVCSLPYFATLEKGKPDNPGLLCILVFCGAWLGKWLHSVCARWMFRRNEKVG